jgi:type II secretory pathway pseudopilin PulG
MKKSMQDEYGVDFLGMRLAVVLIAASLLVSMAAVYVNDFVDKASRDRARQEAGRIADLAQSEYATGCPGSGSTASITVSIPNSVRRVAFGASNNNSSCARAYIIEFSDGTLETHVADCIFSPATLYPGDRRLELKAAEDNGSYAISIMEAP